MADTRFVVDYPPLRRHREELREQRRLRRRRLMTVVPAGVLVVAVAGSWSAPLAAMLAGIAAFVVFFVALPGSTSVDAGHLAGVEGEAAVLDRLKQLPDDFVILNRVKLPDETLANGERELDFVVAGPTGLWVIEVKNTPGHVQVHPDARHWPLARRAGCGSRPSWNAVANPLPQVRAQVEALERWLLRRGVTARAQAIVVFSHPEVAVTNGDAAGIPVLVRDQLFAHLKSNSPKALEPAVQQQLADLRPA